MLGEKAQPEVADYQQLKYLLRCVNESMRLYPHPPVLLRRAQIQDELPGGPMASSGPHHSSLCCIMPASLLMLLQRKTALQGLPAARSLRSAECVAWCMLLFAPELKRASAALQGVSLSRPARMS